MHNHNRQQGLSLVELLIVVIILGLIAGAWFGYGHIKKAARIKTVMADVEMFYEASNNFKQTYQYLPGDIPNATAYWFNSTTCPGVTWKEGQCNGNGNSQISWGGAKADSNESIRAWQHLVLGGFLTGPYDGIGIEALPGSNVPESSVGGIGYDFHYGPVGNNEERNYIGIGAYNKGGALQKAVLTPSEAYNIDAKIDDGLPMKGNFLATDGIDSDSCTKGFVSESSTYEVTKGTPQCIAHRNIDKQVPIEK